MENLRHHRPLAFPVCGKKVGLRGALIMGPFIRSWFALLTQTADWSHAAPGSLVSDTGRRFLVNASARMNAQPCENAIRDSCLVSAQSVYIPTAVPSGKLARYRQPRTITNTRAHERLRNKPSPPMMARVEIRIRKIATAALADAAIRTASVFSDNGPLPVNPMNNNNAAKMLSAPNTI